MTYVPTSPLQGAEYYRLQSLIASNYSGLGPNNVAQNPYRIMTGMAFQKPVSGSTAQAPVVAGGYIHR